MTEATILIRCVGSQKNMCLRFKPYRDIKTGDVIDITLPINEIKSKIKKECL